MNSLRRILVATDFSGDASEAFRVGLAMATRTRASLDVVYVWPPPQGVPLTTQAHAESPTALSQLARENAMHALRRMVGGDAVHIRVEVGVPHEVLVTLAASEHFDLMVMGVAASGGDPESFGSVTRRVLDMAPCPVLTVRSHDVSAAPTPRRSSQVNPAVPAPKRTLEPR